MKSKPGKKKRRRMRPVTKLMPHITHILHILVRKNSNAYRICQDLYKTGFTYKPDVLDAIAYTWKADLVTKQKTPGNSIRITLSLSDRGRRLGNLIVNVEKYMDRYSKLVNALNSKFEISDVDKKALSDSFYDSLQKKCPWKIPKWTASKFKNRGWEEIDLMRFTSNDFRPPIGISQLIEESPMIVMNILLCRYRELLGVSLNDTAKAIVQNITINSITDVMRYIQVNESGNIKTKNVNDIEKHIMELARDIMQSVTIFGGFEYKFLVDDVSDVLGAVSSILKPKDETKPAEIIEKPVSS